MVAQARSFIIDRLWQGESGQAPWQRKVGTVKAAKNIRFDIRIGGAVKRNPLEFVKTLLAHASTTLVATELFYWSHIRGAIIAISSGTNLSSPILGWDENGTALQVIDDTSGGFATYMNSASLSDIDVASKRATLVISNRLQNMGDVLLDGYTYDESEAKLRFGDHLNSNGQGFLSTSNPKVTFFSDLADLSALQGEVVRVVSDENLDPAGYYMFFTDTIHPDYPKDYFPKHGDWHRIPPVADDSELLGQPKARYDETKMPHRVVYDEAAGTLTISDIPWRQRISGNEHTVKPMPWGNEGRETEEDLHIKCVEFFSGRLFLISEEHVTSSRSKDFFNLWVENVSAIAANDRISEDVTQSEVGELLRCKAIGEALFLMAEQGQLEFSSASEVLTNVNGRVVTITDFPSQDIDPSAGPGLVTMIDEYGDVHQFTWGAIEPKSLIYTGLLTAHVPKRFHGKVVNRIFMVSNAVFITSDSDMELHETFFLRGAVAQSAWSSFETTDDVVYVHAWGGDIRVIAHKSDTDEDYTLTTIEHRSAPAPTDMLYLPRLDRLELVAASDATYDAAKDETTVPHTGRDGILASTMLVTVSATNTHEFVKPTKLAANGDPIFGGDILNSDSSDNPVDDVFIGFIYESKITLSELYTEKVADDLMTEQVTVFYFETTDFVIEWEPYPGWGDVTGTPIPNIDFQSHRVDLAVLGKSSLETKFLLADIVGDPRTMEITIKSSTPGQFAIMVLEYAIQPQGRGVGG